MTNPKIWQGNYFGVSDKRELFSGYVNFEVSQNNCKSSQSLAKWIYQRQYQAHCQGLEFSEETLTDIFLERFSRKIPGVKIVKYSKKSESLNGSDWSWIFIDGKTFFEIRAQAKRLFISEMKYKSLFGSRSSKTQHRNLIGAANASRSVPLYFFYNSVVNSNDIPPMYAPQDFGCAFMPAVAVGAYFQKGVDRGFNRLISAQTPFYRLFCPKTRNGAEHVRNTIAQTYDTLRLDAEIPPLQEFYDLESVMSRISERPGSNNLAGHVIVNFSGLHR